LIFVLKRKKKPSSLKKEQIDTYRSPHPELLIVNNFVFLKFNVRRRRACRNNSSFPLIPNGKQTTYKEKKRKEKKWKGKQQKEITRRSLYLFMKSD
jgi:hypothetical protein